MAPILIAVFLGLVQDPQKELAEKNARIAELQKQLDHANTQLAKLEADLQVFVRQLEVQLAHIQELSKKQEETRAALVKATNDKRALEAELEPLRKSRGLAPPLAAKITAVANEIGLVVLSVGKEDGVQEGDEFVVSREGDFVTAVVVDRPDRKWSAGRVVRKRLEPKVGDEARRGAGSQDPVDALRKDLDELRRQVRDLSGRLLPSWTAQGVVCEEVPAELRAPLGIEQGLLVRQVRPASPAEARGLRPSDVAAGMTEARLLEAIDRSLPIVVVRDGRRVTLEGR